MGYVPEPLPEVQFWTGSFSWEVLKFMRRNGRLYVISLLKHLTCVGQMLSQMDLLYERWYVVDQRVHQKAMYYFDLIG